MHRSLTALLLAALFAAVPAAAAYDDEEVGGFAVVVQDRPFDMGHEFTLGGGVLPLDAFFKGVTVNGRYTLHFDEFHAWEIVGLAYNFNIDSGLRDELRERYQVQPDQGGLETLDGIIESNYIVKPVSGKLALFNSQLIFGEAFFSMGLATSVFRANEFVFLPGPTGGAGMRFYVTEWMNIRIDTKYYLLFNGVPIVDPKWSIEQVLFLGAGVSFNFGGTGS
jgi:outer membrane beta-barrel protein